MSDQIENLAVSTIQVENERVMVTKWEFEPNTMTGWHTHAYDYVVTPVSDGELSIVTPDGSTSRTLILGESYSGQAGVHHNVVNDSNKKLAFIEVELK